MNARVVRRVLRRGGAFCFVSWRRGREGGAVVLTADLVFHYDAGFREGFLFMFGWYVSLWW